MKILNNKPNFKKLNKKGYICVDMHLHSKYSSDCNVSINKIVKKANKYGFGVAITDHDTIDGALEISKKKVFSIPGIEITCNEGIHILVYFYEITELNNFFNKHIKGKLISFNDLIEKSNKYNCIVSAPHPFSIGCGLYSFKKASDINFVEILNGSIRKRTNKKVLKLKNKGFTAGTDAHFIDYVGDVVVCVKANNIKTFLDALKRKDVFIVGKEISFFKRVLINARKEFLLWRRSNKKDLIKRRLKQVGLR